MRAGCASADAAKALAAAAIGIDGADLAIVWTCLALIRRRLRVAGIAGRAVDGLITLAEAGGDGIAGARAAAALGTSSAGSPNGETRRSAYTLVTDRRSAS